MSMSPRSRARNTPSRASSYAATSAGAGASVVTAGGAAAGGAPGASGARAAAAVPFSWAAATTTSQVARRRAERDGGAARTDDHRAVARRPSVRIGACCGRHRHRPDLDPGAIGRRDERVAAQRLERERSGSVEAAGDPQVTRVVVARRLDSEPAHGEVTGHGPDRDRARADGGDVDVAGNGLDRDGPATAAERHVTRCGPDALIPGQVLDDDVRAGALDDEGRSGRDLDVQVAVEAAGPQRSRAAKPMAPPVRTARPIAPLHGQTRASRRREPGPRPLPPTPLMRTSALRTPSMNRPSGPIGWTSTVVPGTRSSRAPPDGADGGGGRLRADLPTGEALHGSGRGLGVSTDRVAASSPSSTSASARGPNPSARTNASTRPRTVGWGLMPSSRSIREAAAGAQEALEQGELFVEPAEPADAEVPLQARPAAAAVQASDGQLVRTDRTGRNHIMCHDRCHSKPTFTLSMSCVTLLSFRRLTAVRTICRTVRPPRSSMTDSSSPAGTPPQVTAPRVSAWPGGRRMLPPADPPGTPERRELERRLEAGQGDAG